MVFIACLKFCLSLILQFINTPAHILPTQPNHKKTEHDWHQGTTLTGILLMEIFIVAVVHIFYLSKTIFKNASKFYFYLCDDSEKMMDPLITQ